MKLLCQGRKWPGRTSGRTVCVTQLEASHSHSPFPLISICSLLRAESSPPLPPLSAVRGGLHLLPNERGGKGQFACIQLFTRHLSHFNVSIKAKIAMQQQQQHTAATHSSNTRQQLQMGVKQRQKPCRVVITQNTTTASRREVAMKRDRQDESKWGK